jgi:hypothetical protein
VQTVEVIPDHEVKRETGAGVVVFMPVPIRSLNDTKPVCSKPGRIGLGLARRDVA